MRHSLPVAQSQWTHNCVGAANHGHFFVFLALSVVLHLWFALVVLRVLSTRGEIALALPRSLNLWTLMIFHFVNSLWQSTVLNMQVVGASQHLTTNELFSRDRYEHLRNNKNPFNRGSCLANMKELFLPSLDWNNTFRLGTVEHV